MAVELLETENISFANIKTDLFDGEEGELSEFIITEIKEEPELIIEDEIENEKICKFLNENDRTEEDRMNLVWYSCAVCEERFLSIEDLSLHNESHIKSEEEISTSILNISKIHFENDHNYAQSNTQEKRFNCDHCDRSYLNKNMLIKHNLRNVCGRRPSKFLDCSKSFDHNDQILVHSKSHVQLKPYKCDFCGRSYALKNSLLRHCDKIHHNCGKSNETFEEKPFECDLCDHSFRLKSHLVNHRRIHNGGQLYKCHYCDKSFTRRHSAERHINRFHTKEKPFKCDRCDSSYIEEKRLVIHYRKHTGERSYKCQHCDEAFVYNHTFRRHMTIDPVCTKPFKRNRYESSYYVESSLARHYLAHTGGESFQCNHCDKSFKQKKRLQSHIKRTHNIEKLEN